MARASDKATAVVNNNSNLATEPAILDSDYKKLNKSKINEDSFLS